MNLSASGQHQVSITSAAAVTSIKSHLHALVSMILYDAVARYIDLLSQLLVFDRHCRQVVPTCVTTLPAATTHQVAATIQMTVLSIILYN